MRDFIQGTILGGAIGDALGMPFEGLSQQKIRELYGNNLKPVFRVSEHSRHTRGLPRGQYTDDTQLTVATIEAMLALDGEEYLAEAIGRRFVDLYRSKSLIGAGRATKLACKNLLKGVSAEHSGLDDSYGCGAAMRMAPVGLAIAASFDTDINAARNSELLVSDVAYITHANAVGMASSMAMAFSIAHLLGGHTSLTRREDKLKYLKNLEHWSNYGSSSDTRFNFPAKVHLLSDLLDSDLDEAVDAIGTSGLATESVVLAIYLFLREPADFEALMSVAITSGGDTDSVAAMAGNLFGAHNGLSRIPKKYVINVVDGKRMQTLAGDLGEKLGLS